MSSFQFWLRKLFHGKSQCTHVHTRTHTATHADIESGCARTSQSCAPRSLARMTTVRMCGCGCVCMRRRTLVNGLSLLPERKYFRFIHLRSNSFHIAAFTTHKQQFPSYLFMFSFYFIAPFVSMSTTSTRYSPGPSRPNPFQMKYVFVKFMPLKSGNWKSTRVTCSMCMAITFAVVCWLRSSLPAKCYFDGIIIVVSS